MDKTRAKPPNEPKPCQVQKLVFGGWGLTHIEGRTVFVSNVASGEKIMARIYKKAKGVRYAECEQVIEANTNDRTEKKCIHAGICGGCSYQHLNRESQLRTKEAILTETFQNALPLGPAILSPNEFHYRNKMEFGFIRPPGAAITFGLHPRGRFRHILDLKECHLVRPDLWKLGQDIKALLNDLDPRGETGEHGFWQHLTLRQSFSSGEVLVTLEVTDFQDERVTKLAAAIAALPGVAGVCGKKRHGAPSVLTGKNYLEENIAGTVLRYYAENFFQVNVAILPDLLREIAALAKEKNPEIVYDLFSGVGLFGIALAPHLPDAAVIAAEADETAAAIATANAERNGLSNYQSQAMDLYQKGWGEKLARPGRSVAIIDPPRAGLTNATVAEILRLSPDRLIYVSCNPTTQKRDIDWLKAAGYTLKGLRLIDMFPQTYHLESLAWLDKN